MTRYNCMLVGVNNLAYFSDDDDSGDESNHDESDGDQSETQDDMTLMDEHLERRVTSGAPSGPGGQRTLQVRASDVTYTRTVVGF